MERSRLRGYSVAFCFVFIALCSFTVSATIQCKSQNGTPVDWFIIYKLPEFRKEYKIPSNVYYYMDATNPNWQLSGFMDYMPYSGAVPNTLEQIYSNSNYQNTMYMMYNDETPDKMSSDTYGHTKGVVGFDAVSGFWLIHSVPGFPPKRTDGYSWPGSAAGYGQTFLCISMHSTQIEAIGEQLQYNHPQFYDGHLPSFLQQNTFPYMFGAINGQFYGKTHLQTSSEKGLLSIAGNILIYSFAKNAFFGKDLYKDMVLGFFEANLYVETWKRGQPMCSDCSRQYHIYDVDYVQFGKAIGIPRFRYTKDHSKWAVTENGVTCIGDINRMMSQKHRGGGTVCIYHPLVAKQFLDLINEFEPC